MVLLGSNATDAGSSPNGLKIGLAFNQGSSPSLVPGTCFATPIESKMHLLRWRSAGRQFANSWFLFSRQFQWSLNSLPQWVLMNESVSVAHRVTLRPEPRHSNSASSPREPKSRLHAMKSSMYSRHRPPIVNDADFKGAEVAPTSSTCGIEEGSGVGSIKTSWLNCASLCVDMAENQKPSLHECVIWWLLSRSIPEASIITAPTQMSRWEFET